MYVCVCMYICTCICICMCMNLHMYMYIFIFFTYTQQCMLTSAQVDHLRQTCTCTVHIGRPCSILDFEFGSFTQQPRDRRKYNQTNQSNLDSEFEAAMKY